MKFLDNKKLQIGLMGTLGLSVVVFLGVAYWGLSTLQAKSKKLVDLKVESAAVNAQLTSLSKAKQEVQKYGYFKSVAKEIIPNDKDQAQAILEIFKFADQSGIVIQNITFPNSNLTTPVSGTSSSGKSSAASASSSKLISQASPVTGIKDLYSIQLTISPQTGTTLPPEKRVTYSKMLNFLSRIEHNERTAQITQAVVQPKFARDGSVSDFDFTLTINIFIKP